VCELRDQRARDARHGADAQLADAPAGEPGEVGARGLELSGDRVGVGQELRAGLRQLHGAPARRARHERHADDALERLQLLADRRLRVAEPHRRTAHRALARDRLEGREMPEVEPGPFRKGADDWRW
jgi:hypothetical protein